MHFYIIAISFYMNYSMFCQVKKPHLSKIKPDKHERSPTEVKGTGYEYLRIQFFNNVLSLL